jgi:hypothetical protein
MSNEEQNSQVVWKIVDDSFKQFGHSEKQLRMVLHKVFTNLFNQVLESVEQLQLDVADREDGLIEANIDQQSLLYVNAVMIDKLKRMGAYENEHRLAEKRRAELVTLKNKGINIRGGEIPKELLQRG